MMTDCVDVSQVMDYNIGLGKQLLPLVVQVLKYCTCPQLRHYFQQPPRCSLWALKPHIRQMWLKALLVILYKVLDSINVNIGDSSDRKSVCFG